VKRGKYLWQNKNPDAFPYYFVIAAIIKNEAPYITEWIEFHLLQGVEKIYIYDNASEDNLKEVIAPYIDDGLVEYIFWPSKDLTRSYAITSQIPAYNDAINRLEDKAYWIAFIDGDEFMVPIPGTKNTVAEILADFEGCAGVALNWLTYGYSGHIEKSAGLVIERFKSCSDQTVEYNRHTKLIVNPRFILRMEVHHAKTIAEKHIVNTRGEEIKTYCMDYPPCYEKMRINHYRTKSFDEDWYRRMGGGVGASRQKLIDTFIKNQAEYNSVPYDDIMDKYVPILKERIEKRESR
jgi:hypothetical protein